MEDPEFAIEPGIASSAQVANARAWWAFAHEIGIPRRFWSASFREARPSRAVEAARVYVEQGAFECDESLVLAGPTGVGKTYAAVSILRALSRTDTLPRHRRFVYFPGACAALLDPDRRAEMLARLTGTSLLVLDDFGVEYVKEGGLLDALTDEIIWHREAHELPTVITTNLTANLLRDRCSDRVMDRLRGWGAIVECPGESLRTEPDHDAEAR